MNRSIDPRWRQWAPLVLLALVLGSVLLPGDVWAQTIDPMGDPDEGDYRIGLYANADGTGDEIRIGKDTETFTAYLGLSGDPVRVFSGAVFRLPLPDYLEPAGPVRWTPIPGLKEKEQIFEDGGQTLFLDCAAQEGDAPLILGRVDIRVDPRFREATLTPEPHLQFGMGVQLCEMNGAWPKRNAEAVGVRVVRTVSFWDRLTSIFD